jgi:hypothetical protein
MIFDLTSGDQVSASNMNGRSRASTGSKSRARSGWELAGWALLELAIDDTKILCRYGLIDAEGELKPWPKVKKRDTRKPDTWQWEPMRIACMCDPLDHARLREFWLDPMQGQTWCDLVGCKLPAKDIWAGILKHHAK